MGEKLAVNNGLKKVLGFPSLFIITIGLGASQGSIVSILQGVGHGGGSFFIAVMIAFILALCYMVTYSELALMMPKAGSISTYTAVSSGHFLAIVAAIASYVAPAIFAGPAELFLLQNVLDSISPGSFPNLVLLTIWAFAVFNILGINLFASIESIIIYTMLIAILVIGLAGINTAAVNGASLFQIWEGISHTDGSIFSLVTLALFAFMGLEVICPLIEETKHPERNIPKAMFMAGFALLIGYSLLAFAALRHVPAEQLENSNIPHWILGPALFKSAGKIIIATLAITATTGIVNGILAAVPRLLYGMGHHKQLPKVFMTLHPKWKTPWFGIIVLSGLMTIPLLFLGNSPDFLMLLLISTATCMLVTYIIAHVNVIVLRIKYPDIKRPFKSTLYPVLQIVGIVGMGYAIFNNSPTPELTWKVYLNSAIFIGITGTYAFFWIRFKMKRGLFEAEPIDEANAD